MALAQPELAVFSAADQFPDFEQVSMHERIVAVFGTDALAPTLARCTPVGFNDSTSYYGAWIAPDPTVLLVNGGFTGGTWGLTIDGIVIANTVLAWDDAEALVASTILAETGIAASVDLTAGVYTVTFDADAQVATLPVVTADVTQLTGGTPAATVTAGTATFGLHTVVGFVWPDEIALSATEQVQDTVFVSGRIAYSYIEATVDVGDVTALQNALKPEALSRGIVVEGLPGIH